MPARWDDLRRRLRGERVPLGLKVGYALFVAVLVPVYWWRYGPGNFLWFSDIALFVLLLAVWLESRLLVSMMAVGVLLLELAWHVDYFGQLLIGGDVLGLASYMFDETIPLFVRALSLFHVGLVIIMVWLLYRLGYDPRALPAQMLVAWVVLPATWLLTDPQDNINWVFGIGDEPRAVMPPLLYLLLYMLLLPIVVYLPTHWLLKGLFMARDEAHGGWRWMRELKVSSWSGLVGLCVAVGVVFAMTGCTTVIVPPTRVADPVEVYLLDLGRTPSLVLPTDDGRMVRYVYGDWEWYALDNTGVWRGFMALFVPTQGTLGRAAMPGPPTLDVVREQAGTYIEAAYTITVERAQVNRLRETIDARHRQSIHTAVASSWSDLVFVHDPKRYTMFYNSNHRTAEWLEALGCEVRGWPVLSNWEVREAEGR